MRENHQRILESSENHQRNITELSWNYQRIFRELLKNFQRIIRESCIYENYKLYIDESCVLSVDESLNSQRSDICGDVY